MGNSACCTSLERKEALILQNELMVEIEETNVKNLKEDSNSNKNISKGNIFKKTSTVQSPMTAEYEDFTNPLPNIVIIRRKKNY